MPTLPLIGFALIHFPCFRSGSADGMVKRLCLTSSVLIQFSPSSLVGSVLTLPEIAYAIAACLLIKSLIPHTFLNLFDSENNIIRLDVPSRKNICYLIYLVL